MQGFVLLVVITYNE